MDGCTHTHTHRRGGVSEYGVVPPLLKVPGTSSLVPITCFIRAPIFGCRSLSDESVRRELRYCWSHGHMTTMMKMMKRMYPPDVFMCVELKPLSVFLPLLSL